MKKLIAIIVIVALILTGGFLWISSYINSPAFAEYLTEKATAATGAPTKIGAVKFSLFKGVTVQSIAVDNPVAKKEKTLLSIAEVALDTDFFSLLSRKPTVQGLSLKQPKIGLELNEKNVPRMPESLAALLKPADTAAKPSEKKEALPAFLLETLAISDAAVMVRNASGARQFEAQNLSLKLAGFPSGKGEFNAEKLIAPANLTLSALHTPVVIDNQGLTLAPLQAKAYGGNVQAAIKLTTGTAPGFTIDTELINLDVAALLKEITQGSAVLSGSLSAKASIQGSNAEPQLAKGQGNLSVRNGRISGSKVLQELAAILNVPGLANPDLSELNAQYIIADERVVIKSASLRSTLFSADVNGSVGFNQRLNLDARVAFTPTLLNLIPASIRQNIERSLGPQSEIRFKIWGTAQQPQTNLKEVLVTSAAKGLVDKLLKDRLGDKLFPKLF